MKAIVASVLLALPVLAAAQSGKCDGDLNQLELNFCIADEAKAADRELNAVYRQAIASLEGNDLAIQRLRQAQRLWLKLRDADAEALYPVPDGEDSRWYHGSMYPMLVDGAKAEITRARTQWLRTRYVEREEGEL